jgi:hypothetical protein
VEKADGLAPDAIRIDVGLKVGMEMALADQTARRRHAAKLTAEIGRKAGIQIGRDGQKVHLREAMTNDVARLTNATIVVAEA